MLVAAALFVVNIWRRGWTLPIIAVGLWLFISVIVGAIYPSIVQKFTVQPAENRKERPYISRNIEATRKAFGIENVSSQVFNYNTSLTADSLQSDAETIRNIRLWDPSLKDTLITYKRLQEIRSYYAINDIDVDRYMLDGADNNSFSTNLQ